MSDSGYGKGKKNKIFSNLVFRPDLIDILDIIKEKDVKITNDFLSNLMHQAVRFDKSEICQTLFLKYKEEYAQIIMNDPEFLYSIIEEGSTDIAIQAIDLIPEGPEKISCLQRSNLDAKPPIFLAIKYRNTQLLQTLLSSISGETKAQKESYTPDPKDGIAPILSKYKETYAQIIFGSPDLFHCLTTLQNKNIALHAINTIPEGPKKVQYLQRTNPEGELPIFAAIKAGNTKLLQAILSSLSGETKDQKESSKKDLSDNILPILSKYQDIYVAIIIDNPSLFHSLISLKDKEVALHAINLIPDEIKEEYLKKANHLGETPIFAAIKDGNNDLLEIILSTFGDNKKAKIEYLKQNIGSDITPIIAAINAGNSGAIKILLNVFGEDKEAKREYVEQLDGRKNTIISVAARQNDPEVIKTILNVFGNDNRAKLEYLNQKNQYQTSPLDNAISKKNNQTITAILNSFGEGRDSNKQRIKYLTAYNKVHSHSILFKCALSGDINSAKAFLDSFGNNKAAKIKFLYQCNKGKLNPLHKAAQKGDSEFIKTLLDVFKGDEKAKRKYLRKSKVKSKTVLHAAAKSGNFKSIKTLSQVLGGSTKLTLKNLTTTNNSGHNPLYEAASSKNPKAIEALLNNFEDGKNGKIKFLEKSKNNGTTLINSIITYSKATIITTLLSVFNGDNEAKFKYLSKTDYENLNPLCNAAKKGKSDCITALLESLKGDKDLQIKYLNQKSKTGETAFAIATKNNNVEAMKAILNAFGDNK